MTKNFSSVINQSFPLIVLAYPFNIFFPILAGAIIYGFSKLARVQWLSA